MRLDRLFLAAIVSAPALLPAAAARATGFGVNAHIPGSPAADRIAAAGIEWVRIDFLWSLVEPERDVYDWTVYDALVDRLEARGLRIYAGFGSTPQWATSGSEYSGAPDDPDDWREFCYLAATRYAGRVDAWGLWNEPNLTEFWEGTRQQYIDTILVPGARAVAVADPSALVCAPDLAHIGSTHWEDWLEESILAAGDDLDVVTHHLYPSSGRASTVTYDLQEGGPLPPPLSPPAVRDVLADAGWWQRPFWLTETGVESGEWGESTQADFVADLLHQWYAPNRGSRNWVDRIFFYEFNDGPSPSAFTWGLLYGPPGFEEKPAYPTYADVIGAATVDDSDLLGTTLPDFIAPGSVVDAVIAFRNTGTAEWGNYRLTRLLVETEDGDGWTVEVDQLGSGESVEPGASHSFKVRLTAPDTTGGALRLHTVVRARLERAGIWSYGDMLRHEITVTDIRPPVIIVQPEDAWIAPGRWVTLRVQASGDDPMTYRWMRNGIALEDGDLYQGTDTASLTVTALGDEVVAFYFCAVGNTAGTVLSDTAEVAVGNASPRNPGGRVTPGGASARDRRTARERIEEALSRAVRRRSPDHP